jgi:hypothetical protein
LSLLSGIYCSRGACRFGIERRAVGVIVSPELALVDEELRIAACAELPPVVPDGPVDRATAPLVSSVYVRPSLRGRIRSWRIHARPAVQWVGVLLVGGIAGVFLGRILNHVG